MSVPCHLENQMLSLVAHVEYHFQPIKHAHTTTSSFLLIKYSPSSIVDDLFYNTANVTISLCEIEVAQFSRSLVVMSVASENTTALSLRTNDTTHIEKFLKVMTGWCGCGNFKRSRKCESTILLESFLH